METAAERRRFLWVPALFAATLIAYWPALRGGMIWNDSDYVTAPYLRSWHGLGLIWFKLGATQQYYPFLHSAFWVEYRLWGGSTLGYHLANVLLHATAACLFVVVLQRLWGSGAGDETLARSATDWAAILAGFLFALHPVYAESVAWISEQKNTLSIVLYFLAGLAYLRYYDAADASERRPYLGSAGIYVLATGLFVLSLLAKSVTATLPAALLVVLWWRHGRLGWKRDVVPLLPWFVIGAASGLFSSWVEKTYIGASGAAFELGFGQRLLLSGRIIWFYLAKLVWPANLIFIYPRWRINMAEAWQYVFLAAAIAVAVILWALRHRGRGPLAAYLFFAGSLFPVLGFFNVYAFIFSFVADHWQYLPSLGIIALPAWGWGRLSERPSLRPFLGAAAVALIVGLGLLTWRQSRMYDDIKTFYETTIAKNPDCWMARNNLGNLRRAEGRPDLALTQFRRALQSNPNIAETHNNLGTVLRETNRPAEAIGEYREAVRLNPKFADAFSNLGVILSEAGRLDESSAAFRTALKLNPRDPNTYNGYAIVLAQTGRNAEAESQLREALRLDPGLDTAYSNMANVYCQEGKLDEGIRWYREALRREPGNVDVRDDLGMTLAQLNRFPEALAEFEEALKHNPKSAQTHFNLYLVLMSLGRPDEAFTHFHEARRLDPTVGARN